MPPFNFEMTKFRIKGVRCVIVTNDEYTTAYLNIEDAPDILFVPVSYRGDLPKVLEGFVEEDGKWTGWDYPEDLPIGINEITRLMGYVIKQSKKETKR